MRLKETPGPLTLNGPIVDGYAVKLSMPQGEVMLICPDPELAEAIGEFLASPVSPAFHVLVGQPPWYQNQMKESTLQDQLELPGVARTRRTITRGFL